MCVSKCNEQRLGSMNESNPTTRFMEALGFLQTSNSRESQICICGKSVITIFENDGLCQDCGKVIDGEIEA